MLENELDIRKLQGSFDFKGFLLRAIRYWYVILACISVGLGIAYYINLRAERLYKLETLITIKEEQNPFFTSTLNLTFNWGGASDKVETIRTILGSRAHNEEVVRLLQLYIHYKKEGRFRLEDIHTKAPFKVVLNESGDQLLNVPVKIQFLDKDSFELSYQLEESEAKLINYIKPSIVEQELPKSFKQTFQVGTPIKTSFLDFVVEKRGEQIPEKGEEYFIEFTDINSEINNYQDVRVSLKTKGASMLVLSKIGANRDILADYLNTTVALLSQKQLDQKNLFATNTIAFIDKRIKRVSDSLKQDEDRLKTFRQKNQIFDLSSQGSSIFDQMSQLDVEKNAITIKLAYLNQLENYLKNSQDYSDLPAPAVSGFEDPTLVKSVTDIVNLSIKRSNLQSKVKNPLFYEQIDREIDALKNVLFQSISSAKAKNTIEVNNVERRISRMNYEFNKLPAEEQELFNIERSYKLSETSYSMLLEKRNEAGIVKAANVSDVRVLDPATNLMQKPISPNPPKNYLIAFLIGLLLPTLVIMTISFADQAIRSTHEIEQLSGISVLGVVGRSHLKGNLVVFDQPRSAVSEAFRALRSSLQYFYRSKSLQGSKILMITSSISGEGKTFCSINIASVFALSGKKTILVGLDLRKPKIFGDFDITNDKGVVDYLMGDENLNGIIQKTRFKDMDVITSGPIPPNPAELIIGEDMKTFVEELKQHYDYIIFDTPPLGLVADAVELSHYADATLYIVRQGRTKKGMLNHINDKYKSGEIKNISFVLNDYRHKSQYGYGYNYGYGYGYGGYGNGYHEEANKPRLGSRIRSIFKRSKA
ncbi:polysaccharide biosynthesis tyrosine autokinase [Ascidiimonas sp. W6]|uniref:GumC family protein n=1 Tax=Ascidiimonas meishanensis TaxID=3128903 RepID=UPI0030EECA48